MRHGLAFAALLLPLAGCVVPPPGGPVYGGGYPQPAYGDPDGAYPGYAYNGGSPTLMVEGAAMPLIYYGGGWGYWDGYHRWHGAPSQVGRYLDRRHPGGAGYRPYGGGQFGRPGGGGYYGGNGGDHRGGYGQPGGPPRGFAPAGGPPRNFGPPPGGAPHGFAPPPGGGGRPGPGPSSRPAPPSGSNPSGHGGGRHEDQRH